MLNGYSGIRTRNFGLCLPSLLVGQTMTRQSWTGSLDFSTGRMSRSSARFKHICNVEIDLIRVSAHGFRPPIHSVHRFVIGWLNFLILCYSKSCGQCMQAPDSQEINAASYCIVQLTVLDFSGPGPPLLYCRLHNSLSWAAAIALIKQLPKSPIMTTSHGLISRQ